MVSVRKRNVEPHVVVDNIKGLLDVNEGYELIKTKQRAKEAVLRNSRKLITLTESLHTFLQKNHQHYNAAGNFFAIARHFQVKKKLLVKHHLFCNADAIFATNAVILLSQHFSVRKPTNIRPAVPRHQRTQKH
jgi:hypothetical protein